MKTPLLAGTLLALSTVSCAVPCQRNETVEDLSHVSEMSRKVWDQIHLLSLPVFVISKREDDFEMAMITEQTILTTPGLDPVFVERTRVESELRALRSATTARRTRSTVGRRLFG